jgi:hypothetical protein
MDLITKMSGSLGSGAYDDMTNDELYDLVLGKRYNVLFSNCLLLLVKIINFEDRGGDRLQDKGFAQLRQKEERDVRDLRRNVEKRCDEFLHFLRAAGAPFQVEKGGKVCSPLLVWRKAFSLFNHPHTSLVSTTTCDSVS